MNNSPDLFSYLQTSSLPQAINIINTLNCKVSLWRGRKFYHANFKGAVTYNAILEVIQAKAKQSNSKLSTEGMILSLKNLQLKGENQLDNSLFFTRIITLAKRLFTSASKKRKLKDIEQIEIKNNKNTPAPESQPETQPQAPKISSKNNRPASNMTPPSGNNVQDKCSASSIHTASANNRPIYASASEPSMPQADDNSSQEFGMPYSDSTGNYYYFVQPITASYVYGLNTNPQYGLNYPYIYIDMNPFPTPLDTYTPQYSSFSPSWQPQGNFNQYDLLFWKLLMESLEQNYENAGSSQYAYSTASASQMEKTEAETIKEKGITALSSLEEMLDLKGSLTQPANEGNYQKLEAELKKAKRIAELKFHPDRRHFTNLSEKEATEQFKKFQQILEDLEEYLKLIKA